MFVRGLIFRVHREVLANQHISSGDEVRINVATAAKVRSLIIARSKDMYLISLPRINVEFTLRFALTSMVPIIRGLKDRAVLRCHRDRFVLTRAIRDLNVTRVSR